MVSAPRCDEGEQHTSSSERGGTAAAPERGSAQPAAPKRDERREKTRDAREHHWGADVRETRSLQRSARAPLVDRGPAPLFSPFLARPYFSTCDGWRLCAPGIGRCWSRVTLGAAGGGFWRGTSESGACCPSGRPPYPRKASDPLRPLMVHALPRGQAPPLLLGLLSPRSPPTHWLPPEPAGPLPWGPEPAVPRTFAAGPAFISCNMEVVWV